jgi:hypothetical protein
VYEKGLLVGQVVSTFTLYLSYVLTYILNLTDLKDNNTIIYFSQTQYCFHQLIQEYKKQGL